MTTTSPINDLELAIREAIRVRGVLRARMLFRAEPGATNACVSAILKAVHAYSVDGFELAADQASQIGRLAVQGDNDVRTITMLRTELDGEKRLTDELTDRLTAAERRQADLVTERTELQARLAAKPAQNRVRKPRQTQTTASTGTDKPQTGTGDPEAAE